MRMHAVTARPAAGSLCSKPNDVAVRPVLVWWLTVAVRFVAQLAVATAVAVGRVVGVSLSVGVHV